MSSKNNIWRSQAACLDLPDEEKAWFFANEETHDYYLRYQRAAQRVCFTCPVQLECLKYALKRPEPEGVWGGMTTPQRIKLRKRPNTGLERALESVAKQLKIGKTQETAAHEPS